MHNARLDATEAGIKIARRNINNLRYADDTILMAECKQELKSLLMNWLKIQHSKNEDHGIQSHHFMAHRWGNTERFSWAPRSPQEVTAVKKLKDACSLDEKL